MSLHKEGIKVGTDRTYRFTAARFFPVLLIVVLIFAAASNARAQVASIQMLAPNVGWATTGNGNGGRNSLFWTSDGGAHWHNISPNPFPNREKRSLREFEIHRIQPEQIASVFFLDTHRGWVLFCCGESDLTDAKDDGRTRFDLAMTSDSGATWSIALVDIPAEVKDNVKYADGGQIHFADPLHGWLNLTTCQFGHTCLSQAIATSDAGRTWRPLDEEPGGADPSSFVTPSLGWQVRIPNEWVGNDENAELYVTRDGSNNWKQVRLPFPQRVLSTAFAKGSRPSASYHDLPKFTDTRHGFIPVTYLDEKDDWKSVVVLFETGDAGRTWKPIRSIANLYLPGINPSYQVDIADSTLFVISSSKDGKQTTLYQDGPDGRFDTDLSSLVGMRRASVQLSFAIPKQGWLLGEQLFSTSYGGRTWSTLTPESDQTPTTSALSPTYYPIDSMQLLTPKVGWALSLERGLFWTQDKGLTWKEITPSRHTFGPNRVASVFFLDTKHGWALSPDAVFSTSDAGANWSMTWLGASGVPEEFLGSLTIGQISFADSLNGWVSLEISKREGVRSPWLLVTSDGGRAWHLAPTEPEFAGLVRLVTPMEGWIRSPMGDSLLATHDGAHSWEKVSLAPPNVADSNSAVTYDLPIFEDSQHGFLAVTYSGGLGRKAVAALFATDDGGYTWKPDSTLTDLPSMPQGNAVTSTVARSTWITATAPNDTSLPMITPIASGGTLGAAYQSGYYGDYQLSFVTPSIGWVLMSAGQLLSTADGGASWTELDAKPSEQSFLERPPMHSRSQIASMQLLSRGIGVVTASSGDGEFQLLRTDDDGVQWKDISALTGTADSNSSNYFFLDGEHGWLLFWHLAPQPTFELESTADGGATWSKMKASITDLEALTNMVLSQAHISFVDPRHGWMTMEAATVGRIDVHWEVTADGGKTWKATGVSPIRPPEVRFVSPTEAWMIQNEPVMNRGTEPPKGSNYLFVTRDAAKTWQKVSVKIPSDLYSPNSAFLSPGVFYGIPTFTDIKHGFLPVTYTLSTNNDPFYSSDDYYAVLFATDDGGVTWKPDRTVMLHSRPHHSKCRPCTVFSRVQDSKWILAEHSLEPGPAFLSRSRFWSNARCQLPGG